MGLGLGMLLQGLVRLAPSELAHARAVLVCRLRQLEVATQSLQVVTEIAS